MKTNTSKKSLPKSTLSYLAKITSLIPALVLSSCYEHDTPFTTTGNKKPEPQLLGVWKDNEDPTYYKFEKVDEFTLKMTRHIFNIEVQSLKPAIEESKVIFYQMDNRPIMIGQLLKSNADDPQVMQWGYFPYSLGADNQTLDLCYLDVPKNGDLAAVRKALIEDNKSKLIDTLEKTTRNESPPLFPLDDRQEYIILKQKKMIEGLLKERDELKESTSKPKGNTAVAKQETAEPMALPVALVTNHQAIEDTWLVDDRFDYGARVTFDVTNIGAPGIIEVTVTLTSSEGEWKRSQKVFFDKGETKKLAQNFLEITLATRDIQYRIHCVK